MQSVRVVKRYAKALLNFALEQNNVQETFNELSELVQVIDTNANFKSLLNSPIVKSGVKMAVLEEIFVRKSVTVERFITLLCENKRLSYLYAIAKEYCQMYLAHQGQVAVVLTTAIPMSKAMQELVLQRVIQITKQENIAIENIIDKSIIGGFILRVGDVQYNASVAHKISQVKKQFLQDLA